ncbi:MAG: tetratricopeptide repeat protein [Allosphingosinicella sp.]|uniref:tetratricopeptide repeat protein n=1 Tax=Allosphingosinicella sp. TaxID=2823234 RepID=UPI003927790A
MTGTRKLLVALLLAGAAACNQASAGGSKDAYERGLAALEQGQPRTARIEFMNALQANPGHVDARLAQARTYLILGDGIAAESEILRAREAGAPVEQTRHLMAHAKLLQNHPDKAIAEADQAAGEHAAYAARIKGRAHMAQNDNMAAAAEFARAAELAPGDSDIWTDFGRFRRHVGDLAGALEAADKAVAANPRNTEALVLRGELTRSQYGLQAAVEWFDRALEVDPGHVTALLERATTYGDLGRMRDMLADSRQALSLSPNNPVAFYLQAMLAARARDFELARAIYQRTGGVFDDKPAGMLLASAIDYQTGNVEQAVRRLDRLVADQPNNRKARRLLAAAQWKMGDARAATATLKPIADSPDADSYTLTLIGKALERQGDREAAARYIARAAQPQRPPASLNNLQLDAGQFAAVQRAAAERPDHAPTQIVLIAALLGRGQSDEALERARRLQSANPGVPDAHVLVGDALGVKGNFAGAAEEYRKAANLAFTEPVAMRMIEALERSNQRPAADQVLRLFLEQNPRNVPAQLLLAGRHMEARNWAAAATIYENLRRRLGDRDATILNNLAWAYSEQNDYARAIPLARKAWELDRENPATADTLGWLLFKSGQDKAEGLSLLERAARGAPSDADIRRHLETARRG